MHCIEPSHRPYPLLAASALLALLSGCSVRSTATSAPVVVVAPPAPGATAAQAPSPAVPAVPTPPRAPVPVAAPARNWDDYRVQVAKRLVAANPNGTYMGVPPEPLLAIPVLEIELYGDGSVRHITVLRQPSQATDTVKLAIDAVRRAAPFGDVSRLPRPWKFAEVFLFNDERRFKPRTLD